MSHQFNIVIETAKVKSNHRGAQIDCLYVIRGGINNIGLHIAEFTAKDTSKDAAWVTAQLLREETISEMPDEYTRSGINTRLHNVVGTNLFACSAVFSLAEYYIRGSFPHIDWDSRYNEAGYAHFHTCTRDYPECKAMMTALVAFLTTNHLLMEGFGMPTTFLADAILAQSNLVEAGDAYIASLNLTQTQANDRTTAINNFYSDYILVSDLAKKITAFDKAARDGYVYTVLLAGLRPPHQVEQIVNIDFSATKNVMNCIENKIIKNVGTGPIDAYDRNLPITPENKHTIAPNGTLNNTFGNAMVFINTLSDKKGAIQTTRLVHAND